MATPDRIKYQRHVTALVAPDTTGLLAERVRNLLAHGRRIAMTQRYTYVNNAPDVLTGLTVDGEPRYWAKGGDAGFQVALKPGLLAGFGFAAYAHDDATEADARKRYHAADAVSDDPFNRRRDMTEVAIDGGLPGDGPARDDQIIVRHWNSDGVCDERVIVFDYDTGRHNDLTAVRDELRDHMANLGDKQPWDNQAMFERVLAALEINAATTGAEG